MNCMYIILGCQLWWTFLSGSLPLLYYFKLLLLCIYFWQIKYLIWSASATRLLRKRKPPPRHLTWNKNDPEFESLVGSGCPRIAPKMLWIHYLVGHFAEYRQNRPVAVRNGERSEQVIRNPHPGPDHLQKFVILRIGVLFRPCPICCCVYVELLRVINSNSSLGNDSITADTTITATPQQLN